MNQSVKTDDELLALLEHTMRTVARLAPDMSVDETRHEMRRVATAAAAVIVVAGAAGAGVLVNDRREPPPLSPGAPATAPVSSDTSPSFATPDPSLPASSPSGTQVTIPDVFPAEVPRPDTFDTMTYITWDGERVGWQFFVQGEPADSVERCTQYAAFFDASWNPTAITNEAASVLYARFYSNADWRVGIYCTESGDYLVQVMPTAVVAVTPPT